MQKGQSANMLKIGMKRRRTKAEIKAEKEEEALKQQDIEAKLARLQEMEQQLGQLQQENEQAKDVINQLHAAGQIDIDDQGLISPAKRN